MFLSGLRGDSAKEKENGYALSDHLVVVFSKCTD